MERARNIKLKTERLSLEPLSENDAPFIQELVNTEGWLKFIGNRNVNNREEAVAYIHKVNGNKNLTYWTITLQDTDVKIGIITLIKRDYLDYQDIGFALLPQFSSKGYAYEATKALLDYLILENIISDVFAIIIPENVTSIKLIEKLGFFFEKSIDVEKDHLHVYKRK